MLDKKSEIILDYAISRYNNSENYIDFTPYDAHLLNMSIDEITIICKDLTSDNYFSDFDTYFDVGCRVQLTNKGLSYFEHKRYNKFRFWFPTIISILALLRPEVISLIKFIVKILST